MNRSKRSYLNRTAPKPTLKQLIENKVESPEWDGDADQTTTIWNILSVPPGGAPLDETEFNEALKGTLDGVHQSAGDFLAARPNFGPESTLVKGIQSGNARIIINRLWLVNDMAVAYPGELGTHLTMVKNEYFPGSVFTSGIEYEWSLCDVRTFLTLIGKGFLAIDNYNDDTDTLLRRFLVGGLGDRHTPISRHAYFLEESNRQPVLLSPNFLKDVKYYVKVFEVVAMYRAWNALIIGLVKKILQIEDEKALEEFSFFIDQFAQVVFRTLFFDVPESPNLIDDSKEINLNFLVVLIPASKKGIQQWKFETRTVVEDSMFASASIWEFSGTCKKHYNYRKLDIGNEEGRRCFTELRVQYRLNTAMGSTVFLGYFLYYLYGLELVEMDEMVDDAASPTDKLFDSITALQRDGLDISSLDIETIWKIDAILDVIIPGTDISANEEDDKYETDRRVKKKDAFRSKCLFNAFTCYAPATAFSNMREAEMDAYEAKRLREQFDHLTRSEANTTRLIWERVNEKAIRDLDVIKRHRGLDDEEAEVEANVFEYKELKKQLADLESKALEAEDGLPWLWQKNELKKKQREFDDQWHQISELCNTDNMPWLITNDSTGLVQDPSSGNTYGRPLSDEWRSEIERRIAGIPTMYWYATPSVRQMGQFDIRRLHGGDGFIVPPSPQEPSDGIAQWEQDRREYDDIRRRCSPYQIASMFAYREPPTPGSEIGIVSKDDTGMKLTVKQSTLDAADDKEETLKSRFKPLEGSTDEELQQYLESWWTEHRKLTDTSGSVESRKAGVSINRSAGSAKEIAFRFKNAIDNLNALKLTSEERNFDKDDGQLEWERVLRQPQMQNVGVKARVHDKKSLQEFETFQLKSEQRWLDIKMTRGKLYPGEFTILIDGEKINRNPIDNQLYTCIDINNNDNTIVEDEKSESKRNPYRFALRLREKLFETFLRDKWKRSMALVPIQARISYKDFKESRRDFNDLHELCSYLDQNC